MPAINYYAIKQKVRSIIDDADNINATVLLEDFVTLDTFTPHVVIMLENRRYIDNTQSLSAGQKTRYYLDFSIVVSVTSLVKQDAIKFRDDLVGKIEVLLLQNRTLGDLVNTSWVEGGELNLEELVKPNDAYWAAGEIRYVVDAEMSTV